MAIKSFPFEYLPGATPLDPDETGGLLATYITTQGELSQIERENILQARTWSATRKHKNGTILTDTFLRKLHLRMFNQVWEWAGTYRHSDKSIGVAWTAVPTAVKELLNDTAYWIEHSTYSWDELGARFHHRLVFIHPFSNGNGRHARLMTDILMRTNKVAPFSWGKGEELEKSGVTRAEYIKALQDADKKMFDRLIRFARS